jgi:TonB-dependent receptor
VTGINPTTGLPILTTTGSFVNFPSPRPNATRMGNITALRIANLPVHVSRDHLADAAVAHPEWFVSTATVANYEDAYYGAFKDFKESVPAAYVMGNTRMGKLQIQTGVRWEQTKTQAKEFDPLPADQLRAAGIPVGADGHATTREGVDYQYQARPRVKRTSTYDDLFPSFSAKYSIRENIQAQFGYSYTIRRPAIGRLAGVWDIDDSDPADPRVTVPNPKLEPERSKNYVARLAWYIEPVGSLTFLVSQNDISNSRVDAEFTAEEFGYGGDPEWGAYTFETSANAAGTTRVRNLEVGYNQQLAFLPGPFKGLNLNINYSRTYASIRKPGTLPHKFSGGVSMNFWRVRNLRLGAIWQDDAQWTTTIDRFQRHNIKFDLSGDIRLTQRVALFFAGRNILNEPRTTFDPNPNSPEIPPVQSGYFNYGTNWVFGVKGNF